MELAHKTGSEATRGGERGVSMVKRRPRNGRLCLRHLGVEWESGLEVDEEGAVCDLRGKSGVDDFGWERPR